MDGRRAEQPERRIAQYPRHMNMQMDQRTMEQISMPLTNQRHAPLAQQYPASEYSVLPSMPPYQLPSPYQAPHQAPSTCTERQPQSPPLKTQIRLSSPVASLEQEDKVMQAFWNLKPTKIFAVIILLRLSTSLIVSYRIAVIYKVCLIRRLISTQRQKSLGFQTA